MITERKGTMGQMNIENRSCSGEMRFWWQVSKENAFNFCGVLLYCQKSNQEGNVWCLGFLPEQEERIDSQPPVQAVSLESLSVFWLPAGAGCSDGEARLRQHPIVYHRHHRGRCNLLHGVLSCRPLFVPRPPYSQDRVSQLEESYNQATWTYN